MAAHPPDWNAIHNFLCFLILTPHTTVVAKHVFSCSVYNDAAAYLSVYFTVNAIRVWRG